MSGTNTKKITVAILLVLTIIIGIITVYLGFVLRSKLGGEEEPTPTSTPKISVTVTPKITEVEITSTPRPSQTPGPTSPASIPVACGQSCEANTCESGSQCITVDGSKRCVNSACLNTTNTPPSLNNNCQADMCTPLYEIEITKEAAVECVTGSNQKKMTFVIKITNPTNNPNPRSGIVVKDEFDAGLIEFIDNKSISNSGTITDNIITWNNINLAANGGTIELSFEFVLPSSEYGKTFSNTAFVLENNLEKGRASTSTLIEVIPCTALISDEIDRIIIGVGLIFLGVLLYKIGFHNIFGNLLYTHGGRSFEDLVEKTKGKYEELKLTENERFEQKIIKKAKDK